MVAGFKSESRSASRRNTWPECVGICTGHHQTRANSKQSRVLGLLSRPSGATIASVMRSTGWQPHTVRGFLAAVVRKKLGLRLESEKADGERVYRIIAGKTSADSAGVPSA
jgi:hypothetical protein